MSQTLLDILPKPENPIATGDTSQWVAIETILNISLPDDYKRYINTFGTGKIAQFIWIFSPFSENRHLNLLIQIHRELDSFRVSEKEFNIPCPFPLYPEIGGVLPWGVTDNGDVLFWKTSNNPADWTIIVQESRGPLYQHYPETLTTFLLKMITHEIKSQILPILPIDKDLLFLPKL